MTQKFLTRPQAIIFDWDNTLVDTAALLEESLEVMIKSMGYETLPEELALKIKVHKSARDVLPEIFGERWEEAANIYQTNYRNNRHGKLRLMTHVNELLSFLYKENIYMAILSNKTGTYLREELEILNLVHYFSNAVGSLDAIEDKPSALAVNAALNNSSISSGPHVWLVGDNVIDMQCAYNAGCTPIFYSNANSNLDNYDDYKTITHFKSHKDLLEALQSSNIAQRGIL